MSQFHAVALGWKPDWQLRWPENIYLQDGYIFKSRFLAGEIEPISLIFGTVPGQGVRERF